jgi:hypothetical protein
MAQNGGTRSSGEEFFMPQTAESVRCFRGNMMKKQGVDSVHTLGFGFGCTDIGLVRIGDVFGGVADFQGERLVRVPPRAQCFRRSGAFRPLSVDKLCCEGPLRGPFSLVAGCLLAVLADRLLVVRYLFMDVVGSGNMT